MEDNLKWSLTAKEKSQLISALTSELLLLRVKAEISQDEIAEMIGISRQTYGAIERGAREMSWSNFLSLVLFFDCNKKTHQMLGKIDAIPQQLMKKFNMDEDPKSINLDVFLGEGAEMVINSLDEQAMRSIRTMIMVEYARCTSISGDAVVRSFDGLNFALPSTEEDIAAEQALKKLKERNKNNENTGG